MSSCEDCDKHCMDHSGHVERIDSQVELVHKLEKKVQYEMSEAVTMFTQCANEMAEATVSLNSSLESMKHFNSFGVRIAELEGKWKIREALDDEEFSRTEKTIAAESLSLKRWGVGIALLGVLLTAVTIFFAVPHIKIVA